MFYKIVYGLVAIQLPSYIEHPMKITRHMHSLSYRQIHTAANYYQFSFFPMSIVLWNRLPKDVVLLSDLDSFKQAVSKITHSFPQIRNTVFILFLISHLTNTISHFFLSPYHTFSLTFTFFFYSCTGALKFHIILKRGCWKI